MDHGVKVASVLANSFSRRCSYISESDAHVKEKAIQFGFVLGKSDGGLRFPAGTDRAVEASPPGRSLSCDFTGLESAAIALLASCHGDTDVFSS